MVVVVVGVLHLLGVGPISASADSVDVEVTGSGVPQVGGVESVASLGSADVEEVEVTGPGVPQVGGVGSGEPLDASAVVVVEPGVPQVLGVVSLPVEVVSDPVVVVEVVRGGLQVGGVRVVRRVVEPVVLGGLHVLRLDEPPLGVVLVVPCGMKNSRHFSRFNICISIILIVLSSLSSTSSYTTQSFIVMMLELQLHLVTVFPCVTGSRTFPRVRRLHLNGSSRAMQYSYLKSCENYAWYPIRPTVSLLFLESTLHSCNYSKEQCSNCETLRKTCLVIHSVEDETT